MKDTEEPAIDILDPAPKALSQMAYDRLLDQLIKREIPVGSVLQERRLAESLDISRTPVREALNRLESEGFVTRKPGRVLVVKEFSTRELIETLHVRQIMESEAISLATPRIPEEELGAVEAEIRVLLATPSPSAEADWQVDSRLHRMIAAHSGNAVLAGMIESLRVKTYTFNLDRVPERFEIGHQEHLAMIDAVRRRDREAAREAIQQHIENVKKSIILKLSSI
ncbi:GntR family transcriptional regulator [Ancylobacter sonchi]|uniref:GntR family transcriptional regulator n=1 Tax=Ancylobacter sonchi TaxID=1937790 RepID=UPI001BD5F98A|nr:GntR family transcriptional regulator [Ancylobacter sonchi]MBS7534161.1 GntR family transcriptional regulator [Ancylobacter sonchi]